MKTFVLEQLSIGQRHHLMLSAVGPRPIAFASTIDDQGQVNLSPFSFFNLFSTNPPIAIFSPSRGRDGSLKHTHLNILEVPEVCINLVSYDMVQKMSLSSNSYPKDVNEFTKSGFSMMASHKIKPPYVKEAPIAMESIVDQVISLGGEGASGNLVICRILLIHVQEKFLDDNDQLDTTSIDLVGRMGGNWYCRAFDKSLFEVNKPGANLAIGVDQLPEHILKSDVLSANDIGVLGSLTSLPLPGEIEAASDQYKERNLSPDKNDLQEIHREIKNLIQQDKTQEALALSFWYTV